ncbi:hypothetical protein Dimus_006694 [Dionaea muscipula]
MWGVGTQRGLVQIECYKCGMIGHKGAVCRVPLGARSKEWKAKGVRDNQNTVQGNQGAKDPVLREVQLATAPREISEVGGTSEAMWQIVRGSKGGHKVLAKSQETLISPQRFAVLSIEAGDDVDCADSQRVSIGKIRVSSEVFEALLGSSLVPTDSLNGEVIEERPRLL